MNKLFDWLKENFLEILLFCIAIGNANVIHEYYITTGTKDSWQLTLAVYSMDILIVWSSSWGITGLCISFVLFLVQLISIHSMFPLDFLWIGHSSFAIAVFSGSVGNFMRRGGFWKTSFKRPVEDIKIPEIIIDNSMLNLLSVKKIMIKYNLSMIAAKKIKSMAKNGEIIKESFIDSLRNP